MVESIESMTVAIDVTIRPIVKADLASFHDWYGAERDASFKESYQRHRRGEIVYLVAATLNEVAVGHLGVDLISRTDAAYLWQMGVLPSLQSLGIGTAMVAKAETVCLERNLKVVEIQAERTNPRARALYERLGFCYVDMDRAHDEWIFRKTLYP